MHANGLTVVQHIITDEFQPDPCAAIDCLMELATTPEQIACLLQRTDLRVGASALGWAAASGNCKVVVRLLFWSRQTARQTPGKPVIQELLQHCSVTSYNPLMCAAAGTTAGGFAASHSSDSMGIIQGLIAQVGYQISLGASCMSRGIPCLHHVQSVCSQILISNMICCTHVYTINGADVSQPFGPIWTTHHY